MPLGTAAVRGDLNYIKQSIASGVDMNALYDLSKVLTITDKECTKKKCYITLLIMVAAEGHIEWLKEIIAAGADVNKQDKTG